MSIFDSAISQAPLLTPTIPAAARGVQQITAPEEQEFDIQPMLRRQELGELNRATLDLAVEANRRVTPQVAIEKRAAPRYSISELNELDMESLRQRFEKLPPLDDRPGIMRVLDVIDLPRNLVANALTSVFAPEVRNSVIERGEFGAFGLPRVMGSDMLKSMGIENRIVNAIGGFGIDILTDPLSYIGAPIGGLAVRAGKGSTAVFGRSGQKALMGGLKQVEKGGISSIQDATVRELFETTARRYGMTDLTGAELRAGLAGKLIGERGGGARRTADIVLGTAGSGGDLATQIMRTVNNAGGPTNEAAQIAAVKKFAEQYTLNKGLRLGGANAGSALAHIPFTDVTLYTPAWTKSGKQAVLQRALALAKEGNPVPSEAFVALQTFNDELARKFDEMEGLLKEREGIREAEASGRPVEAVQDHLVGDSIAQSRLDKDMRGDVRRATAKGNRAADAEGDASRSRLLAETEDEFNAAADQAAANAAGRESVNYGRNTKTEDIIGNAQNDSGQVGLTSIAMLAKQDEALKGRKLEGLDPTTVEVGDEFEIGNAQVRVLNKENGVTEVEVTYPPMTERGPAGEMELNLGIVTEEEFAQGYTEQVAREGFTRQYSIPHREGNYIPANRDTLKRKLLRKPEDAIVLNNRRIAERRAEIATMQDNMRIQLGAIADSSVFDETTEIGDVLAMMEMVREIEAKSELLAANSRWLDATEEIAYARAVRRTAKRGAAVDAMRGADGAIPEEFIDEATGELLVDDMVTAMDNMAPDDARLDAYRSLKTQHEAMQSERVRDWLQLTDEDIDASMRVAESFNDMLGAAQTVAKTANRGVRNYLGAEALQLRATAAKILGMGDDVVGKALVDRVGTPFSKAMANYASSDLDPSSMTASLGLLGLKVQNRTAGAAEGVTQALGVGVMGTNNGLVDATRARAQQTVRMASRTEGRAARDLMMEGGGPFSQGLKQIAANHNVDPDDIEKLDTLVTALVARREQSGGAMYWATKPNGEPSAASEAIAKSMESGVLRGREGLLDELDVMAGEWVEEIARIGDGAIANGTLKVKHDNYIPTSMTDDYARAANRARANGLESGTGANVGNTGMPLESFQKAKGTWEMRYKAADGEVRSFLLSNARLYRAARENSEIMAELAGRNPEAQQIIEATNAIVDEFEALYGSIDDIATVNAYGRPLDPFTLNQLAKDEGMFLDLTGNHVGEMFRTRASDLLESTVRQHAVAEAKKALSDYIGQFGIDIAKIQPATGTGKAIDIGPNGRLQGSVIGSKINLADGTAAYVIDDRRIRIGDRTYRTVDTTKLDRMEVNPFEGMMERGQMRYFFPENVAHTIERFGEQMQPEQMSRILKETDRVTRLWRVSTLAHPSWTISNALGNMFIGAIEFRDRIGSFSKNVSKAIKILYSQSDPAKLRELNITSGGQTITGDAILQMTEANGVSSAGRSAEASEHLLREGFQSETVRDPLVEGVRGIPQRATRRLKERYAQSLEEHALNEAMRQQSLTGSPVNPADVKRSRVMKLKASAAAMKDAPLRDVVKAWFRFNGSIDDAFRIGAFLQYLDDGYDVTEAATKTKRSFFNFSDMTQFENQKLRALMPFYAWLRGSMPAMLMNLRDDPMYFSIMPKGFEAIEELLAGEEQVPRHRRPRWINETLGVQIGSDPETRKVLLAGTLLPQEQALQFLSGVAGAAGTVIPGNQGFGGREMMDLLDFGLGQMGPVVKVPMELALGRESFSGRTIGPSSTEGDISLQEYALGQVRWLRETGVGSVRDGALQRSFEQGVGSGVGRLLVGGRLQPGLQEDRRQYGIRRDMAEREEQIRRAFNLAQREGDQEAMLLARDQLMSLFRDFLRSGGNPGDIPKWAREDLMQLGINVSPGE